MEKVPCGQEERDRYPLSVASSSSTFGGINVQRACSTPKRKEEEQNFVLSLLPRAAPGRSSGLVSPRPSSCLLLFLPTSSASQERNEERRRSMGGGGEMPRLKSTTNGGYSQIAEQSCVQRGSRRVFILHGLKECDPRRCTRLSLCMQKYLSR